MYNIKPVDLKFRKLFKFVSILDESEETNSETQIRQEEEPKTSDLPKKDIFRPYCLPDPDIKPFNSSYNVSIFHNIFEQCDVAIILRIMTNFFFFCKF